MCGTVTVPVPNSLTVTPSLGHQLAGSVRGITPDIFIHMSSYWFDHSLVEMEIKAARVPRDGTYEKTASIP